MLNFKSSEGVTDTLQSLLDLASGLIKDREKLTDDQVDALLSLLMIRIAEERRTHLGQTQDRSNVRWQLKRVMLSHFWDLGNLGVLP